ncbi:uncharacterized protein A4U43_C10F3440 [Asparagus officinalis]|uniref:PHD-type domain-containing protein n=1 Tax=Asparagus officinalis TaxID=4686 RepID=A0A5P1E245_ASPOF|nr:uncharacterized protein A4U43_C10F3440 [Asparagus officinalis]
MADSSYALPLHRLSIGDTILVNFEGDRRWYSAEIVEANGDHECEVLYKDGEREWIDLEKVKFRVSSNLSGSIRKRSKIEKSNVKEEEEAYEIEEIGDVLFDNGKVKELVCRRSNRLKQSTLDENICLKNPAGDHEQEEVAFRRSNRLKEKSKLEEKSCLRNSTGDLEHMEDPASPLHSTESEEASDSAYTPSSMYYCRKSTERLIRRNTKGSDKNQYKTDELLNDCSSDDSSTSSTCIRSDGLPCSICQSTDGRSFLIQCRNSTCFRTFHTFCLRPPLQTIENDWVCPICHGGSFIKNLAEDKKQIAHRIHKIVGYKRVIMEDQKKLFQDQFLIKWASLSHHQDSWVWSLFAFIMLFAHTFVELSY